MRKLACPRQVLDGAQNLRVALEEDAVAQGQPSDGLEHLRLEDHADARLVLLEIRFLERNLLLGQVLSEGGKSRVVGVEVPQQGLGSLGSEIFSLGKSSSSCTWRTANLKIRLFRVSSRRSFEASSGLISTSGVIPLRRRPLAPSPCARFRGRGRLERALRMRGLVGVPVVEVEEVGLEGRVVALDQPAARGVVLGRRQREPGLVETE